MQPGSDRKRFQFRLWHPFAMVTSTAVVLSGMFYFTLVEEANRRNACVYNLKAIGLALQSYHDSYDGFPPPYVADAQGKPLYSWRVLILPYLEELDLYCQWRLDEPWDSPHNRRLSDSVVSVYQCPGAKRNRSRGSPPYTDYLAVVGPGMAWEEGRRLSLDDIADTTSNTIMVVEVRGSRIHWAEPVDFDGTASLKINSRPGLSIGSHRPGGAHVVFADASVVHLRETRPEEEIKALLTPDGGEEVNWLREAVRK